MIEPHDDTSLSLADHILRAEQHVQRAQTIVYALENRTNRKLYRPYRYRLALNKAQSILIKLYHKELDRNS